MSHQPTKRTITTHPIATNHNSINDDVAALVDDTKGPISSDPGRDRSLRQHWGWLAALLFLLAFVQPHVAQAAPLSQNNPGTSPQLYLLPRDLANSNVVVDSHIATLRVSDAGGDTAGPTLTVNALYHLRNPASSEVTLPLQLYPGGDQSLGGYQALSLIQNQQPLLLQPGDNGGFLSQITLGAGGATTLNLQYQVPLGNDSLATVRYAPAILNGWAGNISLRVELELPNSIPAESWVEIMPAGWRYSVTTAPGMIGLRWLYDFTIPEDPIRLRFITPRVWAELSAAQSAASANAAASTFVRLGDLYRDLAGIAPSENARQRFYAQAIAAYSGGLASAGVALATPTERASLHIGLADLYRRRLVEVVENERAGYADLMVDEINQALALLPAEDGRATELRTWQLDGMQLQLNQAREQRNWPAALAIVEQMALLPAEVIDPAQIAEDRRFVLIQQALELMEQGNRVAALAVAGDQISADALIPPPQAASLFSGWQISLTVTPESIRMNALGLTQPDRHAEALTGLEEVVKMWENGAGDAPYIFTLEEIPAELDLQSGIRLQIDFPPAGNGFLLARLLPPRPDYALLRGLLTQLAPTIERQTGVIWQQVEMRQPMNLTMVVNEWNALAAGLEEQAAAFEAESNSLDADVTASAEAALTARLQAVNYRTTAAEWRRLARQSALLFRFEVNDPLFTRFKGETPGRAWTVTAAAPSQTFVFQTQVLSLTRLLVGIALAFVVLISIAGVLWGLL
ncbi:MAG: hypothetical protein IT328_21755 [Caldilineaceae bacterium]|nr:hypothetical protein [Caldilineaceae bacterium]